MPRIVRNMSKTQNAEAHPFPEDDPIRVRRRKIYRWVSLGKRIAYSALLAAIVVFAVGAVTRITSTHMTLVVSLLAITSIALLPATIVGYAVRSADRADRNQGW